MLHLASRRTLPRVVVTPLLLLLGACIAPPADDPDADVGAAALVSNVFKDVARVDPALPPCSSDWSKITGCYNVANPPAPSITRELSNPLLRPTADTTQYALSRIQTEAGVPNHDPRVLPFEQLTLDGRLAVIRGDKANADANNVGYLSAVRLEALDRDLALRPGETQFHSSAAQAAQLSALLLLNPVKTMVPELYSEQVGVASSEFADGDGLIGGADLCESSSNAYAVPAARTRSPRVCTSEDGVPVSGRCYNLTLIRGVTNSLVHPVDATHREQWGFHELRSVEVMVAVVGLEVKIYPRKLRDGRDLWSTATFPKFTGYEYGFGGFGFVGSNINKMLSTYTADAGSPTLGGPGQAPSTKCYARTIGAGGATYALNPHSAKACDFWENQDYASGLRIRRTHPDRVDLQTYVGLLPGGSQPEVGPYPVSGIAAVTATWDGRKRSKEVKVGSDWVGDGRPAGFTNIKLRTDQPITAKDGRLLFLRLNGLFYAHAPEGKPACRASSWGVFKPLSGMPSDVAVNTRYPMARTGTDPATGTPRPYRTTQGAPIPFGAEDFGDYAWVDPEATNIFFTAHNGPNNNDSFFASSFESPGVASVTLPSSSEMQTGAALSGDRLALVPHDRSATQVVALGAWTHFKLVVVDNMLNATDFAGRKPRRAAYRLRLYADEDLTVSPGDNQEFTSMASAGFLYDALRPTLPFDVVWKFGTSAQHNAELAFDPYLTNELMVMAHMNAPLRADNGFVEAVPANGFVKVGGAWQFRGDPLLQNAATGSFSTQDAALVPASLALRGGARVEPVAQGGVLGKGVFLDGSNDHLAATFGNVSSKRSFYLGVWIDWRTTRAGAIVEEVLYALPDGQTVNLAKATTAAGPKHFVVLRKHGDAAATALAADGTLPGSLDVELGAGVSTGWFFHLGLVIDMRSAGIPPGSQRVTVLVDGNPRGSFDVSAAGPQLALMSTAVAAGTARTLRIGGRPPIAGGATRLALRAWLDELQVLSLDGAVAPATPALRELMCNAALGTLTSVAGGGTACEQLMLDSTSGPGDLPPQPDQACVDVVHRNPHAGGGAGCQRATLLGLPTLTAGGTRPDTRTSAFCRSCHSDASPTLGLKVTGPLAAGTVPLYRDPRRQPSNPLPVWCGPRLQPWAGAAYVVPPDAGGAGCSTIDQVWTSTGFVP
jgi:hypothetical protein